MTEEEVVTVHHVKIDEGTGHSVLCCPRCGHSQIRHSMVAHHLREKEDGLSSVSFLPKQHVTPLGDNPSARRGAVVVSFECERCGPDLELTITQHKGDTQLGWRYIPKVIP